MKRILAAFLMVAGLAIPLLTVPGMATAQDYVSISVGYAPPPLPWYPQPVCPGDGYIWVPGYWAWGPYGYYWVPGTWVLAPAVGMFWTPGYWAWDGGYYWWHAGYWGPSVGFYGGIDYGYGYTGYGYMGGYWYGGEFYYNRTVTNVDVTYIHNTYIQTVDNAGSPNSRISYNGGPGGIQVRATAGQLAYARARHLSPTAMQLHQEQLALNDPEQRFTVNHGRPQIVATARPGVFQGSDVVRMNAAQNGYEYRGRVQPWAGANHNAAPVEHQPQMPVVNPYNNEYRQSAHPPVNDMRAPVPMAQPRRPTPAPAERTRTHQPQFLHDVGIPYASAYQSSAHAADADNWSVGRDDMFSPRQFHRAPIRASWHTPHLPPTVAYRNPGRNGRAHRGGPLG